MSEGKKYTFWPRPEAHPMNWNELLPPLRHAVSDLLLRLEGAIKTVDRSLSDRSKGGGGEITANCFIVYGERGTGKSTVLLSARTAVCNPETCFPLTASDSMKGDNPYVEKDAGRDKALVDDTIARADWLKRRGTIWLDVLDLESLPPHANMLTTMLTRVRHALYSGGCENNSPDLSSIIEEDAESAGHQLTRLINDATLMWEDIHEVDTRNRANRQIAAADIYTRFRERFKEAMKALSKELGRSGGHTDGYHPVILPIDNIDRSTEHLYNIVKLAQMVASPYLWLVMAGDREDVEAFLTRGYWKELISIGEGAGGAGKEGIEEEDEALVMARRQAAAASHKLLPPSHRVRVELVKPEETLDFRPSSTDGSVVGTIHELLEKIEIPRSGPGPRMKLIELFDTTERSEDHAGQGKKRNGTANLTNGARFALRLPARGVLDLWQLAHWAVNHPHNFGAAAPSQTPAGPLQPRGRTRSAEGAGNWKEDDFRAEKMARTMLRNAIAESKISNRMGLYLQEFIINQEPDGSTTLRFYEPHPGLEISLFRRPEFQYRLSPISVPGQSDAPQFSVRSTIWGPRKEEEPIFQLFTKNGDDLKLEPELPHVVTGWLVVLHDIVTHGGKSWIVGRMPTPYTRMVLVEHQVVWGVAGANLPLWWQAPQWESFMAYDVLSMRWDRFWSFFRKGGIDGDVVTCPPEYLSWTMAIGWMACVLDTFWALAPRISTAPGTATKSEAMCSHVATALNSTRDAGSYETCLKDSETYVMNAAADLYALIMNKGPSTEPVFQQERLMSMRDWLEQQIPRFLSRVYVPMSENIAKQRQLHLKAFLDGKTPDQETPMLAEAWMRHFPFLLADHHKVLRDNLPENVFLYPLMLKELDPFNPFADLYQLLYRDRNSGE